jgi:hypothetical protein
MSLLLTLLSGVCWTWVYVDAVRIGLKHKTYAMPAWALSLNLAWEVIYAYLGFAGTEDLSVQTLVNAVWACFDVGVAYTYFRYGSQDWPKAFPRAAFVAWCLLLFGVGFLLQGLFVREFGREAGARYSAFLQNLLMSVLFIHLFIQRGGAAGQSFTIAVNKWVGTLTATILYGWGEGSLFLLVLGALCSLYDLIYIGLLLWARRCPMAFSQLAAEGVQGANVLSS